MKQLAAFRELGVLSEQEEHLLAIAVANHQQGLSTLLDGIGSREYPSSAVNIFKIIGALAKCCMDEGKKLNLVKVHGSLSKLPMSKRSKGWKSRHFKLDSHVLVYFGRAGETKAKGQIAVTPESFIRDLDIPNMKYCFEIVTSRGALCLAAETLEEKCTWVSAVSRVIHYARTPSVSSLPPQGDSAAAGRSEVPSISETKMGFMEKQPVNSRRNGTWKRRYFVLYKTLLSYYEQEGDSRPKGDFLLDSKCTVELGLPKADSRKKALFGSSSRSNDKDGLIFHVDGGSKLLVLKCANEEDLQDWVGAIKVAISNSAGIMATDDTAISFGASEQVATSGRTASDLCEEKQEEFELIVTDHNVHSASSIGTVTLSVNDCLTVLRRAIQKQTDSNDLPADYSFLRRVPGATEVYAEPAEATEATSWLSRAVKNNYTKVTQAQEVMFTAEKFKMDGNVILLLRNPGSEDRNASVEQRPTRHVSITQEAVNSKINSPKPTPQSEANKKIQIEQKEEGSDLEKSKTAEYESIIQGLQDKIKAQGRQIADLQRALVSMQTSGGSTNSPQSLSQLETFLMQLQRDSYLEEGIVVSTLAKEYKKLFDAQDLSQWITSSSGNPFSNLVRRNCHEPTHIREFLEGMQELLYEFKVQKNRLTEAWWSKKLKDPKFLQLSKEGILEWGQGEAWCEDTPERYAYLMTKMTGKEVPKDRLKMLNGRPDFVESDDEEEGVAQQSAAPVSTKPSARPPPANAALLGSISDFKTSGLKPNGSKPPNAALLGGIQSFKKADLKGGKSNSAATGAGGGGKLCMKGNPALLGGITGFDKTKLKQSTK